MFNKKQERVQAQTFPTNDDDISQLLRYETKKDKHNNVGMFFHVQSTKQWSLFKSKIFTYLNANKIWMHLSIFRNVKESVLRIGN